MNLIVSLPCWKCLPLLAISKNKNKSKITKASLAPQNATLPAPNVSPIKIFLSLIKIRKFPYHLWTMVFAVSSAWNALHQLFPLFPPFYRSGINITVPSSESPLMSTLAKIISQHASALFDIPLLSSFRDMITTSYPLFINCLDFSF